MDPAASTASPVEVMGTLAPSRSQASHPSRAADVTTKASPVPAGLVIVVLGRGRPDQTPADRMSGRERELDTIIEAYRTRYGLTSRAARSSTEGNGWQLIHRHTDSPSVQTAPPQA